MLERCCRWLSFVHKKAVEPVVRVKALARAETVVASFAVIAAMTLTGGCAHKEERALTDLQANTGILATDPDGVVHVIAPDDPSLFYLQGLTHGRDRLFQMDILRRQATGRLTELLGEGALKEDIQVRQLGLRDAAQRSKQLLSASTAALMQRYADGVNRAIAEQSAALPQEYAMLEIDQIEPWQIEDSLSILKLVVTRLGLDLDLDATKLFKAMSAAGQTHGFNGPALFFEDLYRLQPMTLRTTVADASLEPMASRKFYRELNDLPIGRSPAPIPAASLDLDEQHLPQNLLEQSVLALNEVHWLKSFDRGQGQFLGSNLWGVAAEHSTTGSPMIVNDPHLMLTHPAIFYEWHLVVPKNSERGIEELNTSGMSFPGLPLSVHGQNKNISWGSTNNPVDAADIFLDTVVSGDPNCSAESNLCIVTEGSYYPIIINKEVFRVNQIGNGQLNDLVKANLDSSITSRMTVPFRSFGPILNISNPENLKSAGGRSKALTLQFAGFHGTREMETFAVWGRAANLEDFRQGLKNFAIGSQNWIFMDRSGTLAYLNAAEIPLRKDLQAEQAVQRPPFLVRDGSGPHNWIRDEKRSQGQAIPFAVLPADELPEIVNPKSGLIVNANNDPVGTTLDNNALNQKRTGGAGLYYIQHDYTEGLRAASIYKVLHKRVGQGKKLSPADMKSLLGSNLQYDAELMLPFLLNAHRAAKQPGAESALRSLATQSRIEQAIEYLQGWDYSTPTGVVEGYDNTDQAGKLSDKITQSEIRASVAATLYNVWRAKLIEQTIDHVTEKYQIPQLPNRFALKALYHLLNQQPFTGVGRSGVDFFVVEGKLEGASSLNAAERRDYAVLRAMEEALLALAGEPFELAFEGSYDISTYRWGKLHKVIFRDPLQRWLGEELQHLQPDSSNQLPGIPRDGGYEVVNASGFSSRASRAEAFAFEHGAARRYIGYIHPPTLGAVSSAEEVESRRIEGVSVFPGRPRGVNDQDSPGQMRRWLTVDFHKVVLELDGVDADTWQVDSVVLDPLL